MCMLCNKVSKENCTRNANVSLVFLLSQPFLGPLFHLLVFSGLSFSAFYVLRSKRGLLALFARVICRIVLWKVLTLDWKVDQLLRKLHETL